MPYRGTLAIDCSTRRLGWAVDVGDGVPRYGLIKDLPGMAHFGPLFAEVRNRLEMIIARHAPCRMLWARQFPTAQTANQALQGVLHIAELVCYDNSLTPMVTEERTARIAVLGRGDFGRKDTTTGALIPESGRKEAKATVMAWAEQRGYHPQSDDVGDALVLLEYDRMLREGLAKPKERKGKRP